MNNAPMIRLIWISRSVRLPSARRLSRYVEVTRKSYAEIGLKGLLIAQDRYRLHIIEGDAETALSQFHDLVHKSGAVGTRLIGREDICVASCASALLCLDTEGLDFGASAISLADIYATSIVPGESALGRVRAFLKLCLQEFAEAGYREAA